MSTHKTASTSNEYPQDMFSWRNKKDHNSTFSLGGGGGGGGKECFIWE